MGAPIVGVAPIFALSFFGYGVGKKMVEKPGQEEFGAWQMFFAGAISGVMTTVIMTPGERIKCLLQVRMFVFELCLLRSISKNFKK